MAFKLSRPADQRGAFVPASLGQKHQAPEAQERSPAAHPRQERAQVSAEDTLQAALAQAHAEGFEEGRAAGFAEGQEGAEAAMREQREALDVAAVTLAAAIEALERLRPDRIRAASDALGAVILASVERVLRQSVALHPEALPTLLNEALTHFVTRDNLKLRVPAAAFEALRDRLPPEQAAALVSDPELKDGVIAEGPGGTVEATVDAALEGIEQAIRQWAESDG
ncbi:MAG: hypothetical protein JXX28_19835 [Deltaproteobacteria bacterium]|nr:hypothetical protein [Deltaproteobacteria bacterium]